MSGRVRVMRANYDKPWRCPDWSGPALRASGGPCPGGSTAAQWGSARDHWKTFRCPECGLLILPFALRKADPTYWLAKLRWRAGMVRCYGLSALRRR